MKLKFLLIPVTILIGVSQAYAAAESPIEYSATYKKCMASGDAAQGITSGLLECTENERRFQDGKLNQAYQTAMARLPANRKDELRLSERNWIKSRDAICEQRERESGGGTLSTVVGLDCLLQETVKRKTYLEQYR